MTRRGNNTSLADRYDLHPEPRDPATQPTARRRTVRRTITDTLHRVAELLNTNTHTSPDVSPDGEWLLVTDTPTRKEWRGYGRLITLRTKALPGGGWYAYQSATDDGGTIRLFPLANSRESADSTLGDHRPRGRGVDRCAAFSAVERYMTEVAYADAERIEERTRYPTRYGDYDG